tara:strand:+ start:472 stop:1011 length:540 start_codon:yes stop_codon:yes gene_type:complete
MLRTETRRDRYNGKLKNAKKYPISLCAVNFVFDDNLGYLIRSAACFGAERLYVIGHVPERKILNPLSGSLYDYVEIVQFANPREFLKYSKNEKIKLISAELVEEARSISTYDFDFDRHICLVVGNEQCGIPIEILRNSDIIYVPMPGAGYCLNTSQAANILLYEAVSQHERKKENGHFI